MTKDRVPTHGVGFVDKVGIECLCGWICFFDKGGWVAFNRHLAEQPERFHDAVRDVLGWPWHEWRGIHSGALRDLVRLAEVSNRLEVADSIRDRLQRASTEATPPGGHRHGPDEFICDDGDCPWEQPAPPLDLDDVEPYLDHLPACETRDGLDCDCGLQALRQRGGPR